MRNCRDSKTPNTLNIRSFTLYFIKNLRRISLFLTDDHLTTISLLQSNYRDGGGHFLQGVCVLAVR